jgi:predicted NBD/HSP70 family sugar kinase
MRQKHSPLRAADMRIHNQKIILAKIYEERKSGISQSELVAATGLRAPTLFRIFSSLEEQGLTEVLESAGETDLTKKGRRPIAYTTKKDALYTIGLEFWVSYISIGVFDFRGDMIFSQVKPLPKNIDILDTIDCIERTVQEALLTQNIPMQKILGIGVAAPGQIDIANGRAINYARISGMNNYPLAAELEKRLEMPVIVHNNCSTTALSEYRYGGYDHHGSMFTFMLRSGVGGAFVNKEGVYTNEYKTLEPGHMSITPKGPPCYCGMRGCLQAHLMELDAAYYEKEGNLLFNALEAKLSTSDTEAEKTIRKAAEYLFVAMKNVTRFFSPQSFLILSNGKLVSQRLTEHIRLRWENTPDVFVPDVPLIFSNTCNPLTSQQGASDLVISSYFS